MAGHVARRTGAECAAGSIGRPTAMTVAEAATHRGIAVAVARHWTVAVVHRRIVVAVAIGYRHHHHQGHQTIGPHHRFLHVFYVLMVELFFLISGAKVVLNSRQ